MAGLFGELSEHWWLQMAFGERSWWKPPVAPMTVAPAPIDHEDTPFFARMAARLGHGWLLQDEGGHVPGANWEEVKQEIYWVVAGAILLTLLRIVFQYAFAAWWLKHNVGAAAYPGEDATEARERGEKASESAWKALFYTPFWLMCIISVSSEPWWSDTTLNFVGWPNVPISPLFRFFFLGEISFYLHSTIAHFTIEVRRADFVQMALHHIITSILMSIAYVTNYHRIGGILLVMHDVGDVLLEIGKVLLYAGWDKTSTIILGLLIAFWWWFRIIFWAYKVFTASLVHSVWVIGPDMPQYWLLNGFLVTIWALNLFWGYLLLRIAVRKLKEGELEDTREAKKGKNMKISSRPKRE